MAQEARQRALVQFQCRGVLPTLLSERRQLAEAGHRLWIVLAQRSLVVFGKLHEERIGVIQTVLGNQDLREVAANAHARQRVQLRIRAIVLNRSAEEVFGFIKPVQPEIDLADSPQRFGDVWMTRRQGRPIARQRALVMIQRQIKESERAIRVGQGEMELGRDRQVRRWRGGKLLCGLIEGND